ncbi:hypothetical protein HV402_11030 [Bacillus sporothermodurans]|uniref:Uncharacterized protein n=1 Tax=Heyndrickxia sporothermodurans TaxID=46224 RepID=A0AB37HKT5_9BACI|nr:hypothetical protein [Heyndrickxia sporothermodurans]MBL5767997.1 hypothetical protein [Heyndrickxia sporothermodurans]MBL5785876.1 hypothetical protein [Heyndrickxia sporothermodurans]MBL5789382.1 hypothetical protein [Heyndrickxia sporothermodurans]MBL5804073.1 hypothetical protein [Heyndrickxia sporothermodurans]MBL5850504.1 hypothetical protein [Heyndrickxia sporothermodurans]
MVQTSVPRRYTGAVRTIPSSDGWKSTLTEFKLTPEQLERYKAGEKIEDILKGEKEVKRTTENYLALKSQGFPDTKIYKDLGFKSISELTQWKKEHLSPEEVEELRMNTLLAKRNGTANKADLSAQTSSESKTTKNDLQGENEEILKELDRLRREVIDAHKLVTEKDERLKDSLQEHLRKDELINKLQKQLEQSVTLYETAMLDKEQLHKENVAYENNVQTLIRQRDQLQKRCDRYQTEFIELEEEVNGLRRFALTKLKKDVYPA